MVSKKEKVEEINKAIKRSEYAKSVGARAELLPDNRIEYTILGKTSTGKPYRMKTNLRKILASLEGPDARALFKKYGGKKKKKR